jgi:hypothetical protein
MIKLFQLVAFEIKIPSPAGHAPSQTTLLPDHRTQPIDKVHGRKKFKNKKKQRSYPLSC